MAVVDVYNLDREKVGTLELSDDVFDVKVREHLFHEVVRYQLAKRRSGSAKTKERAEISGTTAKVWRQKGTGRARVGDNRSPLWRHGGTVHGPQPRDYSWGLPRKMRRNAIKSALARLMVPALLAMTFLGQALTGGRAGYVTWIGVGTPLLQGLLTWGQLESTARTGISARRST